MDNSLVLFNKAFDSKEYFNKLKYRFELLLIIEKIVKETIYLPSPEEYLAEMIKFSKNMFPDNDFYFTYSNIELRTGKEHSQDSEIFSKDFINQEEHLNFKAKVFGKELNIFQKTLVNLIFNHLFINIYMWDLKNLNEVKDKKEMKANINLIEERLQYIKEKSSNILNIMIDEAGGDNIYFFIKHKDRFEYISDHLKKSPDYSRVNNRNNLNHLLKNTARIRNSYYELYDDEKHYFSALFSHKTKRLLMMPVRSQENLEAVLLITNPIDIPDDLERIIELYKLYFEKLSISFKKTLLRIADFELDTMNNIIAKLIEKTSNDLFQDQVDIFFKHFQNFFSLKKVAIFFKDENENIRSWYRTSQDINCPKELFDLKDDQGIYRTDNNDEYEYFSFQYDLKRRGCLLYERKKYSQQDYKNILRHMAVLIFNVLYSRNIYENMKELDRLAVLGGMAREMAHEIRNPLGGIKLYIEMLKKRSEKDSEIYNNIEKGIKNIENVISDMLLFTRKENLKNNRVDILELLKDSISIINLSDDISIKIEKIEEIEELIYCDKEKISSVFNNILVNAGEALRETKEPKIRIDIEKEQGNLVIIIWNNGKKIEFENRKKIFDPFFTTRKNGNGLGLAICKKIINAHDGELELLQENDWTGFRIKIPMFKGV